jgi:hypothetical protein
MIESQNVIGLADRGYQHHLLQRPVNFLLPGHGWTGRLAHEEGGAERSTRRRSLGEIPGYLREIQARGSQRQTPNSNPPGTPTLINKIYFT